MSANSETPDTKTPSETSAEALNSAGDQSARVIQPAKPVIPKTESEPKALSSRNVARSIAHSNEASRSPEMGEGEEDDETWTNQPSGSTPLSADSDESMDDIEEEEEDETLVVTRKVIQNARDVICEELPARAQKAKLRLHPQLTGAFVIEVTTTGEKFIFDWRGEEPKVGPLVGEPELASADNVDPAKVDCIISISEPNLMAVRSGDLNPQVAMLADKIKVRGRMGPAVYLFNLVAPRMRE